MVNKENFIGIELYINDNKSLFDLLFDKRDEIENNLSLKLDWHRLDNKKASRILYKINGLKFDDHSNYSELINKVIDCVIQMRDVFKKYV